MCSGAGADRLWDVSVTKIKRKQNEVHKKDHVTQSIGTLWNPTDCQSPSDLKCLVLRKKKTPKNHPQPTSLESHGDHGSHGSWRKLCVSIHSSCFCLQDLYISKFPTLKPSAIVESRLKSPIFQEECGRCDPDFSWFFSASRFCVFARNDFGSSKFAEFWWTESWLLMEIWEASICFFVESYFLDFFFWSFKKLSPIEIGKREICLFGCV